MSESKRIYPSAVIHYNAPSLADGDSVQKRWSGLVVEVGHENIVMPGKLDLEAINARCDAATAGPWVYFPPDSNCAFPQIILGRVRDLLFDQDDDLPEDAEFIAHARTDLPALVAEVERLRSMIRAEHMPEGYDVPDDATTELAVQCASLEAHLSHWTSIANTARAEADSLRARVKELEGQNRAWSICCEGEGSNV